MMPKPETAKTVMFCLALLALAAFCSPAVCPAGEEEREDEMSDAQKVRRALQKRLKSGEPFVPAPGPSGTIPKIGRRPAKVSLDAADKIIAGLAAKKLTDAQMVVQSRKMAEDHEQWVKILKRLAEMGNHKAMYILAGKMISSNETMPFYDPDEGFRLLVTAARAGDAQAQWQLASALGQDPYFSTDFFVLQLERFRWHYAAAEQGYAHAQMDLGQMLENGDVQNRFDNQFRLPPEDCIEAYKWLTLAIRRYTAVPIEKGSINAEWNGFALSSRKWMVKQGDINQEQIEEALKRVAAWEKSHPHAYKKFPFNDLD
ncbi:MAG: hypothetical protein PVH87_24380 [Desulfobacteraceae bacterium]|jgi:hypothetical protein